MNQATDTIEKTTQGMMQMVEEVNSFTRNSMDAALRSLTAMTKGWDETARSTGGLMQESMARAVSAGKTIMGAKSMREMMDLHTELMKDYFDCWMTGTGKLSEISARTTKEAIEPVAQQASSVVTKMTQKSRAA